MQILISFSSEKNVFTFQQAVPYRLRFFSSKNNKTRLVYAGVVVMLLSQCSHSFAHNNPTFLHMLMLPFKPNALAYSKRISMAHTIYTSNDGILLNPKSHFVWLHFSNYIL